MTKKPLDHRSTKDSARSRPAGIVRDEKRGNQVFDSHALPCVSTFARCLTAAAMGQRVEVRTCCH